MMSDFGGYGALGELFLLLNEPNADWVLGSFFDANFDAQMNIQFQFHTPEPGTGLLVALPLAGVAWWRKRARAGR